MQNKGTLGAHVQWQTEIAVTKQTPSVCSDLQLWLLACFWGLIAAEGSYNRNRMEVYDPYAMHLRVCQCQMKHWKPERVGKLAPSPGGDKRWGSIEYNPTFTCSHYYFFFLLNSYGRLWHAVRECLCSIYTIQLPTFAMATVNCQTEKQISYWRNNNTSSVKCWVHVGSTYTKHMVWWCF